jgi:hypothetical protein
MKYQRLSFGLVTATAVLLAACSGSDDLTPYDDDIGAVAEADDGVVIGTTWQELSYPTCTSPWADPDGDGWGWEYYHTCIAYRSPWGGSGSGTSSRSGSTGSTSSSCGNQEGTASTMAALAVSAAMELKRWQPTKDFAIGRIGSEEALMLSSTGKARCADRMCANTQALLDFQKNEANGKVVFPGNVTLNSPALRSRLVAKFKDQMSCESQPSNGGTTNCPVEEHTLTFQRSEKGGCDTNYFFVAKRPDGQPLSYPAQLKNKLVWADRANQYIGFQSVGEVVSIDPTYGLNEQGSKSSGSCTAACVKISKSNVANQCCSCGGSNKKYKRAPWNASTYLCQ